MAPPVPKPGGTAGFAGAFGATGGVGGGHAHVNPYMVMRSGYLPGVMANGSNIRAGVQNASGRIHRSMPFQTAPLPPPPPPPAPPAAAAAPGAPAPAATHGFGYAFGRPRRRRGWFSRMWQPETIHEVAAQQATACETVYDSVSGMHKTICNGRVVEYRDAQGNVLRPGDYAA